MSNLEHERRAAIVLANDLRTVAGEVSRSAFHPQGPKAAARGLRDLAITLERAQRDALRLADDFDQAAQLDAKERLARVIDKRFPQ